MECSQALLWGSGAFCAATHSRPVVTTPCRSVKETVLKSVSRFITLCCVLVLAIFALTGCQTGPKHDYPITIEDAKKQETTNPEIAYDEYLDVKNKLAGTDHEKAAEALLMAARLAADNYRFGVTPTYKPDQKDLSPEIKQKIVEKQAEGEVKAHEALKELLKDFGGTKAAQTARAEGFQDALEHRIDERNKKQLSYKIVDFMVAMTGRNRSFSYWFCLLLIAFIVKGVTFPLTLRMYKSQREMQRLQPAIKALQAKYKDDQQELQKKIMEFYKEHGVNPLASCFPMLIQFPFMIWIYNTIRLYEFHFSQGTFLWVNPSTSRLAPDYIAANLGQFDFILLVIYTASMYLTMKLTPATDPQAAQQQKSMSVMTTGMMFFFFIKYRWSAAFVFYWLILNILSAWQSYYFVYRPNKMNPVSPVVLPTDKTEDKKRESSNGAGKVSGTPLTSPPSNTTRPRRPRKPRR